MQNCPLSCIPQAGMKLAQEEFLLYDDSSGEKLKIRGDAVILLLIAAIATGVVEEYMGSRIFKEKA